MFWVVCYSWYVLSCLLHLIIMFWFVCYTWYILSCLLHLIIMFWVILSCPLHLICSELSVTPDMFGVVGYTWYILSCLLQTNCHWFEHQRKPVSWLTVFKDFWPYQLSQWLEEGCRKTVLGVWTKSPLLPPSLLPERPTPELLDPTLCGVLTCKAKAPDDTGCRIL